MVHHHIGGLENRSEEDEHKSIVHHHIGGLEKACNPSHVFFTYVVVNFLWLYCWRSYCFLSHLCGGEHSRRQPMHWPQFLSHLCGGELYSSFIIYPLLIESSPPHRWLRKVRVEVDVIFKRSPPHRWLRNVHIRWDDLLNGSPPHRWLRK
jgi:hypothetical protein